MNKPAILLQLVILISTTDFRPCNQQQHYYPSRSRLPFPLIGTGHPGIAFSNEVCLSSDGKNQPLVFDSLGVVYPSAPCGLNGKGELFQGHNELFLACIGRGNMLLLGDETIEKTSSVASLRKKMMVDSNESVRASCLRVNQAVIERIPHGDENGECIAYRVGFRLPIATTSVFHTVYVICWVQSDNHPKWVKHVINPSMADGEDKWSLVDTAIRTNFRFSPMVFGTNFIPGKYFTVAHQRKVGLLNSSGGDFIARGHLAPAGDFMLACERHATFRLENAVPQWQSHNNGKWKEVERRARLVRNAFLVETGPVFRDDSPRRLFLNPKERFLPVPDSLYKILYDENGDVVFREIA
uniref:Wsv191-like protein n=1 Tax=Metapenaeus ensis nimavirus TaxID=2133794 RepID=A0A401IPC2_9VIRU|nr:MAG: wsv191-like protein [Metapenaeus ensis nimavirus]GBG35468.1 wsv191-like protein [Metapenaeus ensis nimavirus]